MVDSTFRHPKFVLLLVLAGVVLAFVTVAGPRDGGVVGVGDASAADGDTTSTTDPNYDDGVVFTAPGELGEVIVGPTTTSAGVVTSSGSAPGSTVVAPSTTSRPASAAPTTAAPATEPSQAPTTEPAVRADAGTAPDGDSGATPDDGVAAGQATNVDTAGGGGEAAIGAPNAFAGVQDIIGTANAAPIPGPVVVGQLGTRDANSTPWMLLVGANFLVAGGALAALRLRR